MSLPNFPSRPDVFSTPEKRRPRNSRIFEGSSRVTPKSPRKRLYSSADDTIVYSPSTRVYNITELLEHILEYCDWGSLTAVGITLTKLRTIRNRVINKRVEFFLSLFFDRDCLDRFFLKLKALRCAVFGGIVRCIMSAGNQAFFEAYPRELYIVAPFDVNSVYSGSWRRFLGSQDFEFSSDMSGDRLASSSIKRIIHSKQREMGMVVNVVESAKPSLLPAVFSFGHTSACNLMTADNLYCLYPELIQRNENLQILSSQTFHNDKFLVPFNFGLRTYRSAGEWRHIGRPCGIHCEAVWRDSKDLRGSAIIPIACPFPDVARVGDKEDPIVEISSSRVRWTIGFGACQNYLCQNHGRGMRS